MKIIQNLWFDKDMEAAISLYTSLIPNSALEWTNALPAESPSGPAGSVKIAFFTIDGQRYQAFEARRSDAFNHTFSIMIECETQAEIDRLWEALGEGGKFEQCGWLKDRWACPGRSRPSASASWSAIPTAPRPGASPRPC
jgi:predicted 3-demethylubiquinone-9 3-methyltransferase (glyoxalase superfamily)